MYAEKMVLHTDAEGRLIEHPNLPPNATLEAIYLVTTTDNEPGAPSEPAKPSPAEVAPRLAASDVAAVFGDPIEWQRETRGPSEQIHARS